MRRQKRRSPRRIITVQEPSAGGLAPPIDNRHHDLDRAPGVHSQGYQQTVQHFRRFPVDVQFGGLGEKLHAHVPAAEMVQHFGGISGDEPILDLRHRPEQLQGGPLHATARQVVCAQAVDRRGTALDLPAHRNRQREGDGRQRRRKPQHRQQGAPALASGAGLVGRTPRSARDTSVPLFARGTKPGSRPGGRLRTRASAPQRRPTCPHTEPPANGVGTAAPSR